MPCVEVLRLPDGIKKGLSVWVPVIANLHLESKEKGNIYNSFKLCHSFSFPNSENYGFSSSYIPDYRFL